MLDWLSKFLLTQIDETYLIAVKIAIVLVSAFLSFFVLKYLLQPILIRFAKRTRTQFDEHLLEAGFLNRLSQYAPAIVLRYFADWLPYFEKQILVLTEIYSIIILLFLLFSVLDAVHQSFGKSKIGLTHSITSVIQAVKLILSLITILVLISRGFHVPLTTIAGGLGAGAAILMLVFKDTIMSFVAGIKILSSNMLYIGDWIEMPKHNVDGAVIDLSLYSVRVRNGDQTIVTVPASAFIEDSFKNWRGIQEIGGRRIKRSLLIDVNSVAFASKDLIDSLSQVIFLKDYIQTRTQDIDKHNAGLINHLAHPINGRHLTNLGLFRVYISNYLKQHPRIHQGLSIIVRQMQEEPYGIPIEIYCFVNDTGWSVYEEVQSDIFDHLFATATHFGLRLFQHPTGYDYRKMNNT
ncbi:MAG: mechanosensitive ion channel [Leptonema sp. (in: Bacteria)]|nr:mechanosensitive ion channel [Leptonema sp. (in: bacteria)]